MASGTGKPQRPFPLVKLHSVLHHFLRPEQPAGLPRPLLHVVPAQPGHLRGVLTLLSSHSSAAQLACTPLSAGGGCTRRAPATHRWRTCSDGIWPRCCMQRAAVACHLNPGVVRQLGHRNADRFVRELLGLSVRQTGRIGELHHDVFCSGVIYESDSWCRVCVDARSAVPSVVVLSTSQVRMARARACPATRRLPGRSDPGAPIMTQ